MSMGDRGWRDSTENYCDSYVLKVSGSTATGLLGQGIVQPIALFGISVTPTEAGTTGLVDILDSSATANADPTVWSVGIASGTVTFPNYVFEFPRGLALTAGLVITATTVTGSISLLYKPRYS